MVITFMITNFIITLLLHLWRIYVPYSWLLTTVLDNFVLKLASILAHTEIQNPSVFVLQICNLQH
jgi:hypothetical protein